MKVYVVIRKVSTHNSVSSTHLFLAMVYWSCQYFKLSYKRKIEICPWSLVQVFHIGITGHEYSELTVWGDKRTIYVSGTCVCSVGVSNYKDFTHFSGVPSKRKIQTKYKLPTLNWQALKPGQVKGTVFAEIDDENIIKVEFEQNLSLVKYYIFLYSHFYFAPFGSNIVV